MNDIKYLVFSGGGAAGYGHAGAIEQLNQEASFSFQKIEGVAGTSVGAIAALLVSLNYTPEQISIKLASIDLKKLGDGGNMPQKIYRLFTQYGVYKGDTLYQLIKEIIREKTGREDPENVSFEDLKTLGYKDLYIVATKIFKENNKPTGKEKIFSFDKTPKTSVATAILASTAAPGYFRRVRLKKIAKGKYIFDKQGDLFDDGGIVNNFPINIFDKPKYIPCNDEHLNLEVNPHTLGLVLLRSDRIEDKTHHINKEPIDDKHPLEYAVGIFNTLMLKFEKDSLEKSENRKRTIQIDRLGISLGQFHIDEKTKQALIESGKQAVKDYFASLNNENEITKVASFTCKKVQIDGIWKQPKCPQNEPITDEEEIPKRKYGCCVIV